MGELLETSEPRHTRSVEQFLDSKRIGGTYVGDPRVGTSVGKPKEIKILSYPNKALVEHLLLPQGGYPP